MLEQLSKKILIVKLKPKVESKVNKTIGIICKLQKIFSRSALLTIYKPLIRPHLDYGYIIYGKAFKDNFYAKLESLQYNVALKL